MFYSGKNTKVITWAETAFGLETSATHLHGGILESLWCQKLDHQNRFGFGHLFVVNTDDTHLALHIWSIMRS